MPTRNVTVEIPEASLDLLRRLAAREADRAIRAEVKALRKSREATAMLAALSSYTER